MPARQTAGHLVGSAARHKRKVAQVARGRILASGALAGIAIVAAALVVLGPLSAARTDLDRIADHGVPAQAHLVALRTTVADWQFFIERSLDDLTSGVTPDATAVVKGGELLSTQTTEAELMSAELRRVGFTTYARDLDAAMSKFNKAVETLTPVASGQPFAPATLRRIVNTERTAIENVWNLTTQIGRHLSQGLTKTDTNRATDHVALAFWFLLTVASIAVLFVSAFAIVFGRRAGHRERDQRHVTLRHGYESAAAGSAGDDQDRA